MTAVIAAAHPKLRERCSESKIISVLEGEGAYDVDGLQALLGVPDSFNVLHDKLDQQGAAPLAFLALLSKATNAGVASLTVGAAPTPPPAPVVADVRAPRFDRGKGDSRSHSTGYPQSNVGGAYNRTGSRNLDLDVCIACGEGGHTSAKCHKQVDCYQCRPDLKSGRRYQHTKNMCPGNPDGDNYKNELKNAILSRVCAAGHGTDEMQRAFEASRARGGRSQSRPRR